jgi:hypothetical protein
MNWSIGSLKFSLIALLALFNSCSVFSPQLFDVSDIAVQKEQNGYLVEISAHRPIGDVSAFISKDNWLVITLVGATVDFDRLRSRRQDDLISEVEVVGFRTSVQLTLKLKQNFRSCEVIHPKETDNIQISLFAQ